MRSKALALLTVTVALATADPSTAARRRAWVTSVTGTGNLASWPDAGGLGGLAAGDAICRARAAAAGLPNANAYRVWLSTAATDAYCHVQGLTGKRSNQCNPLNQIAHRQSLRQHRMSRRQEVNPSHPSHLKPSNQVSLCQQCRHHQSEPFLTVLSRRPLQTVDCLQSKHTTSHHGRLIVPLLQSFKLALKRRLKMSNRHHDSCIRLAMCCQQHRHQSRCTSLSTRS